MNYRQTHRQTFSTPIKSAFSQSTGKMHRQLSSYGPTVCLINKSPEKESTSIDDKSKIFMLMLEIQRLQYEVGKGKSTHNQREVNEISLLRKQVSHLRVELEKSESQKYEQTERYNRVLYSHTTKLSQYETQINSITRKLREAQDTNDTLRETIKNLSGQITKLKTQDFKMNMSMMNSQAELHKSVSRQRAMEMDVWRQKLKKYEGIINQQKFLITNQKQAIDKLKNTQYEIKQRYEYEISQMNGANEDLRRTINNLKIQTNESIQSKVNGLQKQLTMKEREHQKLSLQLKEVLAENEKIAHRAETLDRRRCQLENQLRDKTNTLFRKEEIDKGQVAKLKRKIEKYKKQISELKEIIQTLKLQNKSKNAQSLFQINTLNEELESKEAKIRKLKKDRKTLNSSRIHKSTSESTFTARTQKMINSEVELNGIMAQMIELQDSNMRMGHLINNTKSTIHLSRFSSYGL